MLVLTRRTDESLVIGENIIITVLAIEGEKVKLGITAPREITVLRKELWQAIQEQNQNAEKQLKNSEIDAIEEPRKFLASEIGKNGHIEESTNPEEQP